VRPACPARQVTFFSTPRRNIVNDEIRMTNDESNPKPEEKSLPRWFELGLGHSFVIKPIGK